VLLFVEQLTNRFRNKIKMIPIKLINNIDCAFSSSEILMRFLKNKIYCSHHDNTNIFSIDYFDVLSISSLASVASLSWNFIIPVILFYP
jgi:hypothetical protein